LSTIVGQTWGASFGDYDKDGWLDLFVFNSGQVNSQDNYMYRNNGDGTFSDVTMATGTNAPGPIEDPVFCGVFFDYNGDGFKKMRTLKKVPDHLNYNSINFLPGTIG